MATTNVEFRSILKYLMKKGMSAKEIIEEFRIVYKEESPSKTFVYKWMAEFRNGRANVLDENVGGRPIEIGDCKEQEIVTTIHNNRRISIRELAEKVHISYGSCCNILKSMGIRKLASRFVPRFLTHEMQNHRKECCRKFLRMANEYGESFKNNILTEDETTLKLYEPESKRESQEWKMPGERPNLKLRSGTSHGRCFMFRSRRQTELRILHRTAESGALSTKENQEFTILASS